MDDLAQLVPLLIEPVGIGVLGGLAIWAGSAIVRAGLGVWERIELARIEVQRAQAEAIRVQAEAAGQHAVSDRALREQLGALEIAVQRLLLMCERSGGDG